MPHEFEYDEAKSCSNKAKHGVEERTRLISVRRSRESEVALYEGG